MFFWTPFVQKRGHYGPRPRWKNFFLAEITKADHQLSESSYFIKISYFLTELWIFFYLEWCFLSEKCHFQQKQLCPKKRKNRSLQIIEKVKRLSKVQKKINSFPQKHFLKNNNEANKQEQSIQLYPKKNLCMERPSKQNND